METLRPTWRSQLGLLVLIALAAGVVLFGLAGRSEWGALLALVGLAVAGALVLLLMYRHYAHRYYVEDGRIEHQVGIVGRHIRSVRLGDLRNINLRQSILERMLGIGSLEFSSAGGSGIEVSWMGVKDPAAIKRRIEAMRAG